MLGEHCIKTWSATQGAFAFSSGEAEFHAMVEAVLRGKGVISLMREVGFGEVESTVNVATDSSAALGIANRVGLGKVRHLDVQLLWIQQQQLRDRLTFVKIPGVKNPADVLTKFLGRDVMTKLLKAVGVHIQGFSQPCGTTG